MNLLIHAGGSGKITRISHQDIGTNLSISDTVRGGINIDKAIWASYAHKSCVLPVLLFGKTHILHTLVMPEGFGNVIESAEHISSICSPSAETRNPL